MSNPELHLVNCQLTFCGLGVGSCLGASLDIALTGFDTALTGLNKCPRYCEAEQQPGRTDLSEEKFEEHSLRAPAQVEHSSASSAALE